MELLKQKRYSALPVADQVIAIFAAKENYIDDVDLDHVVLFREELAKYMAENHGGLRREIVAGKIDDGMEARLRTHIAHFKAKFLEAHPNRAALDVAEMSEQTDAPGQA